MDTILTLFREILETVELSQANVNSSKDLVMNQWNVTNFVQKKDGAYTLFSGNLNINFGNKENLSLRWTPELRYSLSTKFALGNEVMNLAEGTLTMTWTRKQNSKTL